MNIDQLRKLIAEDKTSEVIHQLEEWAIENNREDISDMAALQYAKLRELEDKRLQYTASNQELEIASARLRRSLLDIVNQATDQRRRRQLKATKRVHVWAPIAVATACLAVLVIGLTSVPSVQVSIEGEVDYLQFRLLDDATIDFDLYLDQFEAFNLNRIAGLGREFNATELELLDLTVAGDSVKLDQLALQANDRLAFTAQEDEIQLSLLDGQVEEGKLEFRNADIFVDPIAWDTMMSVEPNDPPQIFTFNSTTASEFRFLGCPPCNLSFDRLPADNFSFTYEKSVENSELQSAVIAGTIDFGNITRPLEEREYLSIAGLENGLISFAKKGQNLHFKLEGKADDIRAGYAGQINSTKPNYLQHLLNNRRSTFFLVGAFWLIGMMWVVRRIFL